MNEQINGLSIYIDMRGSTKMGRKTKIDNINKLYGQFLNYNPSLENMELRYTTPVGDAVLMFFKYNELNGELFDLLSEVSNKVNNISTDDVKYGVGVAYGPVDLETYEINNGNISIPLGHSIDFASKASDMAHKGTEIKFAIFLKNKKKTIVSGGNEELTNYIEQHKVNNNIAGKKSSSKNWYRFDY